MKKGHVEYLSLNHRYYVVIALRKELEDSIFDCHFFDDNGNIKEGFEGFWFNEKVFLTVEKYLFDFINSECGLWIDMYEEEDIFPEKLRQALEITNRQILAVEKDADKIPDAKVFLEMAGKIKALIEKAIELDTVVGFCF
ncbi:MAG: hypothetical protein II655_01815 [Thermoguttaceae bacterium]|nr:hypothetical protein [Thermoguttaceae bacterium]MBQ4202417.1 hypothetical protein [Thermoguttaceae bacterium]